MTILFILIFMLVLGTVVLIHELGHFIFARRAGILCHEFSIGMGPALYKFKRGETVYAIRAIPIGGYVSAAGEDPELARIKTGQTVFLEMKHHVVQKIHFTRPSKVETIEGIVQNFDLYGKDNQSLFIVYEKDGSNHRVNVARDAMYVFSEGNEIQIAPYDRCYESKPWLNRFLFVVMGAGFNFILATFIFILLNFIQGIPTDEPVIQDPNHSYTTPAMLAELQKGDRIVKLNDITISEWDDISNYMANSYTGGPLNITIDRNGQISTKTIHPLVTINTLGMVSNEFPHTGTTIGHISPNQNADKEGLKTGDTITKVNGVAVSDWYEIREEFRKYYMGEEISLTYMRGTSEDTIQINTLKALEESVVSSYSIGISPMTEFKFFQSIGNGFRETFATVGQVIMTLDLLFFNDQVGVSDLSGPVGIFDMTRTYALGGFINLLWWVGFISANIGFVNLLPLPALDGGRLIFLIFEGITKKPVNRKVEGYIHTAGFLLFMLLFLYITFNDVIRLRG
jgi:regulator of sigma E protease